MTQRLLSTFTLLELPAALSKPCMLAGILVATACGDHTVVIDSSMPATPAGMTPSDAEMSASAAATSPLYAVSTCVETADSATGYVVLVDSLESGERPTLDSALEIPGCGVISGPNRGEVLFVGEGESPTLRRYAIRDGSFEPQGALSLAALGIADAFYSQPHFVYLAEDKAYILSGKGAPEIIVWDPRAMEISGRVPLEGLQRDGVYPAFGYAPLRVDDRLYVTARWRNDDGFRQENALVVIDTANDSILQSTFDERCGDFLYGAAGADGTLYFGNGNYASAFRLALGAGTAPPACVLRVLPGELAFDPSYQISLSTLLGGLEGGGLVRGAGGYFVQAFHDTVPAGTEWGDVFGIPAWRWWHISDDFNAAELVDALPPTAAAFDSFAVDGRTYSTLAAADYSETRFLAMDTAGTTPAPGRTVPGWVAAALRVR